MEENDYRQSCAECTQTESMNCQGADFALAAEAERKARIAHRAQFLGKWLWLLFWMFIPRGIIGTLTNDAVVEAVPALAFPGAVLDGYCMLTYGWILLRLAREEEKYRIPGTLLLVAGGINVLVALVEGIAGRYLLTLLVSLAAAVIALIGDFLEYAAHSSVLREADPEQSRKWLVLRRWYVGLSCVALGSGLLMAIVPFLGVLAGLAATIGILVVGILKLVYQYRTAQVFRYYRV